MTGLSHGRLLSCVREDDNEDAHQPFRYKRHRCFREVKSVLSYHPVF